MTETSTRNADEASDDSRFDPETLREREDVEYVEATKVNEDTDHCAVDIEGRAAVGVTNDAGEVLTIVDDETRFTLLPNSMVEAGDDWVAAGRDHVEQMFDLPVEIDEPRRVRKVEHVLEGDDEPHTTSYHVVFGASPAADPENATDGCNWHVEWLDRFPEDAANEDGDGDLAEADVRLFME